MLRVGIEGIGRRAVEFPALVERPPSPCGRSWHRRGLSGSGRASSVSPVSGPIPPDAFPWSDLISSCRLGRQGARRAPPAARPAPSGEAPPSRHQAGSPLARLIGLSEGGDDRPGAGKIGRIDAEGRMEGRLAGWISIFPSKPMARAWRHSSAKPAPSEIAFEHRIDRIEPEGAGGEQHLHQIGHTDRAGRLQASTPVALARSLSPGTRQSSAGRRWGGPLPRSPRSLRRPRGVSIIAQSRTVGAHRPLRGDRPLLHIAWIFHLGQKNGVGREGSTASRSARPSLAVPCSRAESALMAHDPFDRILPRMPVWPACCPAKARRDAPPARPARRPCSRAPRRLEVIDHGRRRQGSPAWPAPADCRPERSERTAHTGRMTIC